MRRSRRTERETLSQEQIRSTKIRGCESCPYFNVNVRVPPQRVCPAPQILVVGEAPGLDDVDQPYTGRAGTFVREMLKKAGIYNECMLDNVCKCRSFHIDPETERDVVDPSTPAALSHCRWQLEHTIEQVRPKIILVLGSEALQWFLPKRRMSEARGRPIHTQYGWILATMHPAAVLRSGAHEDYDRILMDMQVVGSIALGRPDPRPTLPNPVLVCPPWLPMDFFQEVSTPPGQWADKFGPVECVTFDDAMEEIRNSACPVLDIEATGLDPWDQGADVTSLSIAVSGDRGLALPVRCIDFLDFVDREVAYDSAYAMIQAVKVPVFHNAAYDYKYLTILHRKLYRKSFKWNAPPRCTLLMHHLTRSSSSHKLDEIQLSRGYESHKKWVADYKKSMGLKSDDYASLPWWLLSRYNSTDTAVTHRLYYEQYAELQRHPYLLKFWREVVRDLGWTTYHMEMNGLAPNLPAISEADAHFSSEAERIKHEILYNPFVLQVLIERGDLPADGAHPLTPEALERAFNPNSGAQLSRLFFGDTDWKQGVNNPDSGLCVSRKLTHRNSNGFCTDKDVLAAVEGKWEEDKLKSPLSVVREVDGEKVRFFGPEEFLRVYDKVQTAPTPAMKVVWSKRAKSMAAQSVAASVGDYRRSVHYLGTYVRSLLDKHIHADGMLHPDILVHGTRTGRYASFFHTVPRDDKVIKRQFTSRFGKYGVIVSADQSQIEARVVGALSGDRAMLQIFLDGKDSHTIVGCKFFQVETVTKEQRTSIKQIHFGTIYGRTVESLAVKLAQGGMTWDAAVEFAQSFQDWYWEAFPDIYAWRNRVFSDLTNKGVAVSSTYQDDINYFGDPLADELNLVIISAFGRRLYIPRETPISEARRDASNYPVQAAGGDITNWAAARIVIELERRRLQSKINLTIHDAVYLDVHLDELEEVAEIVGREMTRTDMYPWLVGCPLATDVVVGRNLSDLVKLQEFKP